MKKKIIIFLTVLSVLTCLFAIYINAQATVFDSYEEKAILTYDESELVVFDDGASYPSYYIFADSESFTTNYEWLNEKTGKSYSDANVVELCVPTGVTNGGFFKNSSTFTSLLKLNTGKTLQKTNGDFWCNQTLTHVTFGEGFTTAGLGQWFFNGTKVEYIIFSDNSQITTLPSQFFGGLTTLKGIYFGNTITNLGSGTFTSMGSTNVFLMNSPSDTEAPTVYYFKSNLVEGNFYNFKSNSATTTWVFPSAVTGIGNGFNFDMTNPPKNFVFLIDDASSIVINDAIGGTKLNIVNMYFPSISSSDITSMNVAPKTTYFFGDGKKASFNGSWQETADMAETDHIHDSVSDEHFEPTCDKNGETNAYCFCGDLLSTVIVPALGHDHTLKENSEAPVLLSWAYDNDNYFLNAKEQFRCLDCGNLYLGKEIEDTSLFVSLGYSSPETGNIDTLSYSIKINHSNLKKYQDDYGVTVRYGTVAAVGSALGSPISIVDEKICAKAQSVACETSGTPYVTVTIKITNLPQATSVNCCAFAIVNDKVTYLGDGSASDVAEEKQI